MDFRRDIKSNDRGALFKRLKFGHWLLLMDYGFRGKSEGVLSEQAWELLILGDWNRTHLRVANRNAKTLENKDCHSCKSHPLFVLYLVLPARLTARPT